MEENTNIEYKEIFSEKVKIAAIAFLNTEEGFRLCHLKASQ